VTGGPLAAFITGDLLLTATGVLVWWWVPRRDALAARRRAERRREALSGALVPSHRALPGGPSAAGTAAPVYRITDLPAATGARANREG
jgi:glyoxylase-like metal-dependent hydrolase (beta-lactamase superfamily II)